MIDNSDLQRKIEIRQKGLSLIRADKILTCDLFAGEGFITDLLWRHVSEKVVAFERINGKFLLNYKNVSLIESDNKDANFADFNIFDADSYGLVFPIIEKLCNLKGERLICFTEFNPIGHKKWDWVTQYINNITMFDPTAFFIEKSKKSPVLYGYIYFNK